MPPKGIRAATAQVTPVPKVQNTSVQPPSFRGPLGEPADQHDDQHDCQHAADQDGEGGGDHEPPPVRRGSAAVLSMKADRSRKTGARKRMGAAITPTIRAWFRFL